MEGLLQTKILLWFLVSQEKLLLDITDFLFLTHSVLVYLMERGLCTPFVYYDQTVFQKLHMSKLHRYESKVF